MSVRQRAPECTFVRGLLGGNRLTGLPERSFDVVCSVSVMEEVPPEALPRVLAHVAQLVRPGGAVIGTHDLLTTHPERLAAYLQAHRQAGLDLGAPEPAIQFGSYTLYENPTTAMIWYQGAEGPERKYWGHWATVFTAATA